MDRMHTMEWDGWRGEGGLAVDHRDGFLTRHDMVTNLLANFL